MWTGEKLVAWRKWKGWSQVRAGQEVGVSQPSWHGYENGQRPRDAGTMQRIVALTKGSPHAVKLSDFAESDEERVLRRARTEARTVRKDESGPTLPSSSRKAG